MPCGSSSSLLLDGVPEPPAKHDPVSGAIDGFVRLGMQGTLRDGFLLLVGLSAVAGATKLPSPEQDFMFYAGICLTLWGITAPIVRSVIGMLNGRER